MKIFYFTDVYPKLSEIFIAREIAALLERGHEIRLMAMRRVDEPVRHSAIDMPALTVLYRDEASPSRAEKARLHGVTLAGRPGRYLGALGRSRRDGLPGIDDHFRQSPWVARRVERFGADRIHCHFGRQGMLAGWLASRLTGVPFSVTLHGSDALVQPYEALGTVLEDADRVVCVSRHLRQTLIERYPIASSRIEIVHCGIDPDLFGLPEHAPGDPDLLFVGRLHAVKGLPTLIEACAILRERNEPFGCTWVGEGSQRAELEASIAKLGLGTNIRLVGALPNERLPEIYRRHGILVLPSHSEGLSVVGMEAMASGLSIVASRVGGIPELVEDGVNGRLVEPGRPVELADAIVACRRDRRMRPETAARNRQRVVERFNLRSEIEKLERIFTGARTETGA